VDDDHPVLAPQPLGDPVLQEGADHQVGLGQSHRLEHHLLRQRQFHRHLVAGLAKFDPGALGQAVERRDKEQNPHVRSSFRAELRLNK
jgi:hypothetical protein